jgi:glycine/serine hydroxymethyltransferase
METIGELIARALKHVGDETALGAIADAVGELCKRFPVYSHRLLKE